MKYLRVMAIISRATGYRIGISHGRREHYYVVSSKTGKKYHPLAGIIAFVMCVINMCVVIFAGFVTAGIIVEWEYFGLETIPLAILTGSLTCLSTTAAYKLRNLFELRPDEFDEDYEPSSEELQDWDNWVH